MSYNELKVSYSGSITVPLEVVRVILFSKTQKFNFITLLYLRTVES
jgi:hypothetical protein